jgi:hypothetical protein
MRLAFLYRIRAWCLEKASRVNGLDQLDRRPCRIAHVTNPLACVGFAAPVVTGSEAV